MENRTSAGEMMRYRIIYSGRIPIFVSTPTRIASRWSHRSEARKRCTAGFVTNTRWANDRDMIAIIRDRVQAMINQGATVEQVKNARLTADFDSRYGAVTGPWTTDMFVEAVYTSLKQGRPKSRRVEVDIRCSRTRKSVIAFD